MHKPNWYYLIDILLGTLVLVCLTSIAVIAAGDSQNKPGWLLLPITGIYAVATIYMAAGAIAAARASQKSAEVMDQTLAEMRLSRQMQYSPWFSFPDGHRCWATPDGFAHMRLRNLFTVPIAGLWVFLWEMEEAWDGSRTVKYSSMRETPPQDFAADETLITLQLGPSGRTDDEKLQLGKIAEEGFTVRFGRRPICSLFGLLYYVHGEAQPRTLFFDFEILQASVDP